MHGHSFVGRQRPRRCRPDNDAHRQFHRADAKGCRQGCGVGKWELHIDGDGLFVLIFDFGFGQCRATVRAPVDRLKAFLQVTFVDDVTQSTDDVGFEFEVHGQIRVIPVTQHHQTFEVFALTVDLTGGVFTTVSAEFAGGNLVTHLAHFGFDFEFDRQTVAVPARNIRRVFAAHGL